MSHARSERKDFRALAPDADEFILGLSQAAARAGIDKQLLELIKLRASQINGCAFCVQHHILLGEGLGVPVDKLNLVVVWREAPQFSSRERAALAEQHGAAAGQGPLQHPPVHRMRGLSDGAVAFQVADDDADGLGGQQRHPRQIGRASCRERVFAVV